MVSNFSFSLPTCICRFSSSAWSLYPLRFSRFLWKTLSYSATPSVTSLSIILFKSPYICLFSPAVILPSSKDTWNRLARTADC